jgi:hypothetical protein
MQTAYLTPAAPVPTCVDMLPPATRPPGGTERELLVALLLLEGVVPRLATDGDFAPLPQPAASSDSARRTAKPAVATRWRIGYKESTPL